MNLPQSFFVPCLLLAAACGSTGERTHTEPPSATSSATPRLSERHERVLALFAQSRRAASAGDLAEAKAKFIEAIEALGDPETDVNLERLALVGHLTNLGQKLVMPTRVNDLWEQRQSLYAQLFSTYGPALTRELDRTNEEMRVVLTEQERQAEGRIGAEEPGEDDDAAAALRDANTGSGPSVDTKEPVGDSRLSGGGGSEGKKKDTQGTSLLHEARVKLAAGLLKEAKELLLAELAEVEPTGPDPAQEAASSAAGLHQILADIFKLEGNFAAAREHDEIAYSQVSRTHGEHDPDFLNAALRLLGTRIASGDVDAARELRNEVPELRDLSSSADADASDPDLDTGFLEDALGNRPEAIDALERAVDAAGSVDPSDPDRLRELASAGLRIADLHAEAGERDDAEAWYAWACAFLDEHGSQGALVDAAWAGLARSTRGDEGEGRLAELERNLEALLASSPAGHPAIQATRQAIARLRRAQGDALGALSYQRAAFEELSRTLPPDHPSRLRATIALADLLSELGEGEEALSLLGKGGRPNPVEAGSGVDLGLLRDQILEMQRDCQLEEVLALRVRVTEVQARKLEPGDPERLEGLREVAALLRVLGRTEEAREWEMRMRAERAAPEALAQRVAVARAEAEERIDPDRYPPRIRLDQRTASGGGLRTIIAEIEDAEGLLALHVRSDAFTGSLPIGSEAWSLDPEGKRAHFELEVPLLPEGVPVGMVSVAAENALHLRSEFETIAVRAVE